MERMVRGATFADTVTEAEARFGFAVRPSARDGYVISAELHEGLLAVKTIRNGQVEYALCDAELSPIYAPARSLEELQLRFRTRHAS